VLAVSTLWICGCSSIVQSAYYKPVPLASLKSAYIVHATGSTLGCANAAQEALAARGVAVSAGPPQDKPNDVDFFVEVIDRWQWDLAMYLLSLDILFRDNATGELIASGNFHQTGFHNFPDQRKKTFEVIDCIYDRQPPIPPIPPTR